MHPQEYSVKEGLKHRNKVDWQQVKELKLLLNKIQKERIKIVTIGELNQCISMSTMIK